MEALVDLSWREFPSAFLITAGVAMAWVGSRRALGGLRLPARDGSHMQTFVVGFRIAVVGLVLVGLGASWWWHQTWLFVLSLIFGVAEVLEATTHLAILRWHPGRQPRANERESESPRLHSEGALVGSLKAGRLDD